MRRSSKSGLLIVAALVAVGSSAPAQETTFSLDPENTAVAFTLPASFHTVHGRFRVKSSTIRFDPSTGVARGNVVVDATSGETGNKKRDRTMHRDVLQSERYPEITFAPSRVTGNVLPQGESSVQVEGVLRLLGTDHPMNLRFQVQSTATDLRAATQFVVPYVAWGLKNPSNFVLHVADKVELSVVTVGKLTNVEAHAAGVGIYPRSENPPLGAAYLRWPQRLKPHSNYQYFSLRLKAWASTSLAAQRLLLRTGKALLQPLLDMADSPAEAVEVQIDHGRSE